jgi:transcriptional regulator GlxA family with amidase domain
MAYKLIDQSIPIKVVFIVPPGVHLLDITGPAHIFYEASCFGVPVKLLYGSIFKNSVDAVSSSQLAFANLTSFDQVQVEPGNLIFIPGLDSTILLDKQFMSATRPFQNWLRQQYTRGAIILSVCTGAFLLAEAGLLDEKPCTTHWKYLDRFKKQYPQVKLRSNCLFTSQDNIYTSAGVTSGIDLSLYIIERLWGAHLAAKVAKEVVHNFRRTADDPQLSVSTQYRNHLEHRIHSVLDYLTQSFQQPINIEAIADGASMSVRNLTRLFKKTTGITIGRYLEKLRTERAVQLLTEGLTRQAVARQCGLKSSNQLRTLLKRYQMAKRVS